MNNENAVKQEQKIKDPVKIQKNPTPVQMLVREFIKDDPEVKQEFKTMQKYAKKKKMYISYSSALKIIEYLTGCDTLHSKLIGYFDLTF